MYLVVGSLGTNVGEDSIGEKKRGTLDKKVRRKKNRECKRTGTRNRKRTDKVKKDHGEKKLNTRQMKS